MTDRQAEPRAEAEGEPTGYGSVPDLEASGPVDGAILVQSAAGSLEPPARLGSPPSPADAPEGAPEAAGRRPLGWYDLSNPWTLELGLEGHAYRVLEACGKRLLFARTEPAGRLIPLLASEESGVWRQQASERADGLTGIGPELMRLSEVVADEYAERIEAAWESGELVFTKAMREAKGEDARKAALEDEEKKKAGAVKDAERLRSTHHARGLLLQLGVAYLDHLALGLEPHGAIGCKIDDLDADTRYMGAPNGVIDLDDGRLLGPLEGRKALLTKELPDEFDADAEHPDVERLTDRIPPEVAEYLMRELAYSLRGYPERRIIFELDADAVDDGSGGGGGSGKTTRSNALQQALGPYASAIGEGALKPSRKGNNASPDMRTVMPPVRIGFAPEVESTSLDAARMKGLSGQDPVAWRDLYQSTRIGIPSATVWLQGNGLPLGGFNAAGSPALQERIRVVSVPSIPAVERDPLLRRKFGGEFEDGALRRRALVAKLVKLAVGMRGGEPPEQPGAVLDATARLLDADLGDEGRWLKGAVVKGGAGDVLYSSDLWKAAVLYEGGDPAKAKDAFGMTKAKFTRNAREVLGLPRLKQERSGQRKEKGWRGHRLSEEADAEGRLDW